MKTTAFLAALAAFLLADPSASFAQASGSFSFGKPKADAPADLVTVEAKGQGESVEAAKADAARNAIKKAVGELVGAETLVENDELVKDKILTLSNAMIEKADYGNVKPIGDGLFEVPVTAVVKKGQLNKKLEDIGIAKGAVKGDSLAAALFTGKERIANAEKFFAERLKDFPGNVVEAVMLTKDDGTPDVEVDSDTGHVFANVGLGVNMANYAEWTKQLQEVLGTVCLEQERTNLKFAGRSTNLELRNVPKMAMVVIVATPAAKMVRGSTWPATAYYLDAQMASAFGKQMVAQIPEKGILEIILEDEAGEPVCLQEVRLETRKFIYNGGGTLAFSLGNTQGFGFASIPVSANVSRLQTSFAFVVPTLNAKGHNAAAPFQFDFERPKDFTAKFRLDLGEVSEDDLETVRGFKIKLEYAKP